MSTIASYLRPFLSVVLVGQIAWWIGQLAFSTLFFATLLKLFNSVAPVAIFPLPRDESAPSLNPAHH
jgi:hypothetical protein